METLTSSLTDRFRAMLLSRTDPALENAVLRRQLTIFQRNLKHPRSRIRDRVLWVVLRRLGSAWGQISRLLVRNHDGVFGRSGRCPPRLYRIDPKTHTGQHPPAILPLLNGYRSY
jgi:hypothetical protein